MDEVSATARRSYGFGSLGDVTAAARRAKKWAHRGIFVEMHELNSDQRDSIYACMVGLRQGVEVMGVDAPSKFLIKKYNVRTLPKELFYIAINGPAVFKIDDPTQKKKSEGGYFVIQQSEPGAEPHVSIQLSHERAHATAKSSKNLIAYVAKIVEVHDSRAGTVSHALQVLDAVLASEHGSGGDLPSQAELATALRVLGGAVNAK